MCDKVKVFEVLQLLTLDLKGQHETKHRVGKHAISLPLLLQPFPGEAQKHTHTLRHTPVHSNSMLNNVCCLWPFSDRVIHYSISTVTRPNYTMVESLSPAQQTCVHASARTKLMNAFTAGV